MLLTSDNVIVPIGGLHTGLCKDAVCEPTAATRLLSGPRRSVVATGGDRAMVLPTKSSVPTTALSATVANTKRRVRFAMDRNTVRMRRQHDDNHDDMDGASSWMQPEDYLAIRQDNIRTLLAIKEADGCLSQLDPNIVCPRGLELVICKLMFGSHPGNQKKVPKLIVQLYRSQKKLGKVDPKEIRSMYEILSQFDRSRALQTAVSDAGSV